MTEKSQLVLQVFPVSQIDYNSKIMRSTLRSKNHENFQKMHH